MIPKALARSLRTQSVEKILKKIPKKFTLNTGHVLFFYNKGSYLRRRYNELTEDLKKRGYNIDENAKFDPDGIMDSEPWNGEYKPTDEAFDIIRRRIDEKIAMKPEWYRFFHGRKNEHGIV